MFNKKTDNTTISKAVIVFSGGQDSTTCLVQALQNYDEVHAITFDYGQRHSREIEVAEKICKKLNVKAHKIMNVSLLNELAISSLTRDDIPVSHELDENGLPNSFVPGRNILFLTLAGIYAYQIGAESVITGVCETDFSGYPDCRDEFVKSLNKALIIGMDRKFKIKTPLMWLDKAETWALAEKCESFDLIRNETLTCYNGVIGDGCGHCPSCDLRSAGLTKYLSEKSTIMASLKNKQLTATDV